MPTKSSTKDRIIDATWKLFHEMSPKAPTLGDVAKAAGVSRQAVYLHFDNRAKLLSETIQQQKEMLGAADRLKKARDVEPEMVFTSWLATMFDIYELILPVGRTLVEEAVVGKDEALAWDEVIASIRRSAGFVVDRFDELGMLQTKWSAERATDWIYSRMNFTTWHLIVHELGWTQAEAITRTVESLEADLLVIPSAE
jgi:AcrR family transcriptional regulator